MKINKDTDVNSSTNSSSGSRQNDNMNQGNEKNRQQEPNKGDIINGQNDSTNISGQTSDEVGAMNR